MHYYYAAELNCGSKDSYSSKETINNCKTMRARIVHSTESEAGTDSILCTSSRTKSGLTDVSLDSLSLY